MEDREQQENDLAQIFRSRRVARVMAHQGMGEGESVKDFLGRLSAEQPAAARQVDKTIVKVPK